MHVRRASKLLLFSLDHSSQPPGQVTLAASPNSTDVEHIYTTIALQFRLTRLAAELKKIVNNNSRRAQDWYKRDDD